MMAEGDSPILQIEHVGVRYWQQKGWFRRKSDPYWALKDLNFDLYPGDSLGVIGKNGAGKSTLLRLMAGIIEPDAGQVISYGAKTALMTLNSGIYPDLTGLQNILLGGVLLGFSEEEVKAKLDDIIAFAELEDFIHQPVRTYSAGMKARLGFSRAVTLEADVLLVDEVLSVGDRQFRQKSEALMKERIRSEQTVVYVSHSEKSVRDLCNRALWIEDGVVREMGTADEVVDVYEAYYN